MVQAAKKIDLNVGLGQAVREYQTDVGPADYVLFVDKKAVGVIKAKKKTLHTRSPKWKSKREPNVLAGEIIANLEAGLQSFRAIAAVL